MTYFIENFVRISFQLNMTSQGANDHLGLFISVALEFVNRFEMISRGQGIVLMIVILCSYVQGKDECPLQCDCTDDFSIVICRRMENFPVFSFASNVKTL